MKKRILWAVVLLILAAGICAFAAGTAEGAERGGESGKPAEFGSAAATAELSLDFTPAPLPDPARYIEGTYEDASIRVRTETRETDGTIWHLAFVEIASATQLRTWTANPANLKSKTVRRVPQMAKAAQAVIAISGDNYMDHPTQTTYEVRMGQEIRRKSNRKKDILIIDLEGDFHFILADPDEDSKVHAEKTDGEIAKYQIANAFTFGPALVMDGETLTIRQDYSYNPNRPNPRAAIGQTGPLSYVLVIAEGRGKSKGVTIQELADFMATLGCLQAYNLDGGNSAEMVFGDTVYRGQPRGEERGISDILYFGTAVPGNDGDPE